MEDRRLRVVLLPGMDGTGELFREFTSFLPQALEVVAVRYSAHEVLPFADLEGLVRAACAGSGPCVLVAESFSTPVALKVAASAPPSLQGIVLCAGFALTPIRGWARLFCLLLPAWVFRLPLPTFVAKRWLVGPTASQSLIAAVRDAISSVEPEVMASRLRAVLACDVREAASQVSVPMLYIRATGDRLVDSSAMLGLQQMNPQMTAVELEGPHLLLQREPERAAAAIVRFLDELPLRQDAGRGGRSP